MNLFEACFTIFLVLLFTIVLLGVAGTHGWPLGLLAAGGATSLVVLATVLLQRIPGRR